MKRPRYEFADDTTAAGTASSVGFYVLLAVLTPAAFMATYLFL